LNPSAQELLRVASILGAEFALDVLLRIARQSQSQLLDNLDAAFTARLIVEAKPGPVERYAFAHSLIQDSLYAELPPHRLRRLHRRIGLVLEALRGGVPEVSAELAHHFLKAGDMERALKYSTRAGDHAACQFAHVEAAQHYTTAVQLALDADNEALAAHSREKLASELVDTSGVEQALGVLNEALGTYRRSADRLGEARVHHQRSRVFQYHFDYRSAEGPIEDALRVWPADRQATPEFASVLLDAARLKVFSGDHAAARPLAERGLALCERLGDTSLLARALIEVEVVRVSRGDPPHELIPLLDRAEELASTARHWRWMARANMNRGGLKEACGDLLGSRDDRERALAAWERGGFLWGVGWGGFTLALVCLALGDWQAARVALRKTRDNHPHFPGLDVLSAWLDGDHEYALQLLPGYVEDTRRRNDAQNVQAALLLQADFALQLGDLSTAETAAREALGLPVVEPHYVQNARVVLAEAAACAFAPDAEAVLTAARERIDDPGMRCEQAQLFRASGLYHRAAGDLAKAHDQLLASAEVARAQHAVVQLGRTLAPLAETARARADLTSAAAADAERRRIVERIGPAARGLNWTTRLTATRAGVVGADADPLTPREREVALLVARGLTNSQIARALVISERTVAAHIEHINTKLGFTSRTQIGVWAAHPQFRQLTQ
jgi:DNA-binding NarL/FixJ family response regulator